LGILHSTIRKYSKRYENAVWEELLKNVFGNCHRRKTLEKKEKCELLAEN
jgi:hypothetical protein